MSKQPYIPLYIGDWEQDLNCVSIEAEGAALKLIFKLWKAPQRGLLSICFSQMAILLKKSEPETRKIFAELRRNNIFDVKDLSEDEVEIISRRMWREAHLSKVRSESGKEGGRGKKKDKKQNKSKSIPNHRQIPDNESEVENETETRTETEIRGDVRGVNPSQAQIEEIFVQAGLTAEDGAEFFIWVNGKTGWDKINNWFDYTIAVVKRKLNEKKIHNGKSKNAGGLSPEYFADLERRARG